ncbi:MAG: glycosyltransferase family 39 protein [Candidatus Microgenomates bacterium]
MNKKSFLTVSVIFVIGFLLRVLYLNKSAITFSYDQARDAFFVKQIIAGDIKIQGPSANAPGLYHGVLYDYFLAVPYFASKGNPVVADYWLAFFSSATVFVVYFLSFFLFRKRDVSLLSSLFFVFSFEASQYATWLSNPTIGLLFVPLTYLFLWLWTRNKNVWYALLTGVFFGFSIQSDLFLAYHIAAIATWLIICKKSITLRQFGAFVGGLIAGTCTIWISQIKFGLTGIKGLIYLFTGGNTLLSVKGFGDFIVVYLNQIGKTFSLNLFPLSLGFGGFIGFVMIVWFTQKWGRESKNHLEDPKFFLLLYLFSHLPVVFFGGNDTPYLTVGIGIAVCILAAMFISAIWKKSKIFAVILTFIVILSGLTKILSENKDGQTIFTLRREMVLSNLEQAVDYTYQSSGGQRFSINSITAPLWLNTTWSYMYSWYGLGKYGYLPYWHGRSQVGDIGDILPDTPKNIQIYYFIIEPQEGIPQNFVDDAISEENSKTAVVEQKNFGGIVVQKRTLLK